MHSAAKVGAYKHHKGGGKVMYQALYRKWRPKLFSDVVGQNHVTKTLEKEISSGKIGHAYLFIGSRGTGKTTCAKIFAKAVNCQNHQSGNPCGTCELCTEIEHGKNMDIVELDAASNNGVNDIREICESATFTPAKAKYRVYIIDEVHMLSQGAFNALLKTLEEPPAHVIFILATTEAHKIPATILSRCQKFEFHKIKADDIKNRLLYISEKENVNLDPDAALLISRLASGAMRDALTILDKCVGLTDKIDSSTVSDVVGIVDSEYLFSIAESIVEKNLSLALKLVDELNNQSMDFFNICEELICVFRNLMLIKSTSSPRDLMILSDCEFDKLKLLSEKITLSEILEILNLLSRTLNNIGRTGNSRIELEMCLVGLCEFKSAPPQPVGNSDVELKHRIENLESRLNNLYDILNSKKDFHVNAQDGNSSVKESEALQSNTIAEAEKVSAKLTADSAPCDMQKIFDSAVKMENWTQVLEALKSFSPTVSMAFRGSCAYLSDPYVLIDSDNEMAFELLRKSSQRDKIRTAIKEVTGKSYKLGPYKRKGDAVVKDKKIDPLDELFKTASDAGIKVSKI